MTEQKDNNAVAQGCAISREAIGRVLYECEKRRATNADAVVKGAFPGASDALLMEPWDDCKDAFLSDADAVLALLSSPRSGQMNGDKQAVYEAVLRELETKRLMPTSVSLALAITEAVAALASAPSPGGHAAEKYPNLQALLVAREEELDRLRAQVEQLHRSLWLVVKERGGLVAVTQATIENFSPYRAELKIWTDLPTGHHMFEALPSTDGA